MSTVPPRSVSNANLVPVFLAVATLASTGCMAAESSAPIKPARGLALKTVASGLTDPVYLTAPAGDPRLFVVEQNGRIATL